MKGEASTAAPVASEMSQLVSARGKEAFAVPNMRNVHATYLFELEDGRAWRLRVEDGSARIEEGKGDADCVLRASDADMALVMTGRQNLITAVLQGRVEVKGDMALAQKFHGAVSARAGERRKS
jgi:putative sterol carrier protein